MGDNSIFGNASCDVYANYSCTVSAGTIGGEYTAQFRPVLRKRSTIDYSYALSSNPNPGRPKIGANPIAGPTSDSTFNLAYQNAEAGYLTKRSPFTLKF